MYFIILKNSTGVLLDDQFEIEQEYKYVSNKLAFNSNIKKLFDKHNLKLGVNIFQYDNLIGIDSEIKEKIIQIISNYEL